MSLEFALKNSIPINMEEHNRQREIIKESSDGANKTSGSNNQLDDRIESALFDLGLDKEDLSEESHKEEPKFDSQEKENEEEETIIKIKTIPNLFEDEEIKENSNEENKREDQGSEEIIGYIDDWFKYFFISVNKKVKLKNI